MGFDILKGIASTAIAVGANEDRLIDNAARMVTGRTIEPPIAPQEVYADLFGSKFENGGATPPEAAAAAATPNPDNLAPLSPASDPAADNALATELQGLMRNGRLNSF